MFDSLKAKQVYNLEQMTEPGFSKGFFLSNVSPDGVLGLHLVT